MSAASDKNLLLGILAVQMDFVSRDQLLAAMNAWVLEKSRSLDQILLEQGGLGPDTRELLLALVDKHLELHAGNAEKSLASISSIGSLRSELQAIGDDQLDATLAVVSQDREAVDPHATQTFAADARSSDAQRFRILRPHAKGGLGEVSVAYDSELKREVALKEIQERYADDPNSRGRFIVEAEVTGGLEHPGIVPVYGLGQYADGRPFYAMRFIRGDSLQEAVDRYHAAPDLRESQRRLELRKLLGRFVDVCQAIEYGHSRGVLHRDLKPGNIMLGKYGETLVVDWGLAKVVGRQETHASVEERTLMPDSSSGSAPTQMGSAIGTPAYMSPEQAAGRLDELGPASDVYSLGATLYYILTGQAPIKGNDRGSTLRKVQAGEFTRPGDVERRTPKPLEAICLKAMALRPEDRYASPQEIAEEVERYLADEPIAACTEPLTVRTQRWLRKHPKSVAALAAAVLVGLTSSMIIASLVAVANEKERKAAAQAKADATQLAEVNSALRAANEAERMAKDEAEASRREAVRSLVTALQFAPAEQLTAAIEDLRAFREQALPMLREQFENTEGIGKLQTAVALASFGDAPHEYLVEQLPDVPENQAENMLASLNTDTVSNRERVADAFQTMVESADPRQLARMAVVAFCMGNPNPAASMLKAAPDPTRRATLIDMFREWHGDLSGLPEVLESIEDGDFRSGICLALGRTSKNEIDPELRQRLIELLTTWFASDNDGGVHSAAGWALSEWGEETAELLTDTDVRSDRHWKLNSLGLTMLRIPAGNFERSDGGKAAEMKSVSRIAMVAPQKVAITKEFLLSDTEICLKHFRTFIKETGFSMPLPSDRSPSANIVSQQADVGESSQIAPPKSLVSQFQTHNVMQGNSLDNLGGTLPARQDEYFPVYDISWIEAAAFCNWLSRREGLRQVYTKDKDGQLQRDRNANGYRLPTEAEWEFACRAGADTVYVCGNETTYLNDYAAYKTDFLKPAGTFMPNRWGLFDMHGNVAEWCQDYYEPYSELPESDPEGKKVGPRIIRGGTFQDSAGALCSGARREAIETDRASGVGFRVARSLP